MYQKIVVPLDGSELAECIFPHLESICNGCGTNEVILFRVVPPPETTKYDAYSIEGAVPMSQQEIQKLQTSDLKSAQDYLNQAKARITLQRATLKIETAVGIPAEAIADFVKKSGADLVVIATHGRSGISRWAFGSTTDKLLRLVCTPVLMVRAPGCIPGF